MRKSAPRPTQRRADEYGLDDDDGFTRVKRPAATGSLDDFVVRLLRSEAPPEPVERQIDGPMGVVLEIHRGRCVVDLDGQVIACDLAPDLARTQQTDLAVGDDVVVIRRADRTIVTRVGPRRTKLSRPDPQSHHRERVIVANVDRIVVVVSVGSPPLHPRIIDRYRIAAFRGGVQVAVAVNKIDLIEDASELDGLEPYARAGVPIAHVSADRREGLESVRAWIAGARVAFVGHSGVGKSSLVNALAPELGIGVGAVSGGYGRGTHTTRRSTLYRVADGELIDTPGIRSFGLWRLTDDELAWHFPEFADVECRFRDCSHRAEPGCGVRRAVEDGRIHPDRYDTFLRLAGAL